MDNFSSSTSGGYNKSEVNEFVDYVIKKTEDNISLIKQQKEEIELLQRQLYETRSSSNTTNAFIDRKMSLAEKEANLIITSAKDDASRIVNDALLKAEKINMQKEAFNRSVKSYKKKIKNTLIAQIEELDEIEML